MGNRALAGSTPPVNEHADQVRALFDGKAAGWPAKYAADGQLVWRLPQFAAAAGDLVVAGGAVLDLGCGSGELARHLAAAGFLVTGCDIAPLMLHRAAAADHQHAVRWIRLESGWRTLPFVAASLDAVIAASVLEYVPDPAVVLGECARVLRPGGVLLCTVPNVAHPVRWLEWPLCLAARTGLGRIALARIGPARMTGSGPHRFGQYLTYLATSRQRRRARWWYATARRAGLSPVSTRRAAREPLRLLAFTRPGPPVPQNQDDTFTESHLFTKERSTDPDSES
jgi:SAM-dependent methyltransferase